MNARAALRDIVHLASDIGPREATSDNFAEAAKFVQARFERLGYDVRRTKVPGTVRNLLGHAGAPRDLAQCDRGAETASMRRSRMW